MIDLIVRKNWLLIVCEDKVIPINVTVDIKLQHSTTNIQTSINKRGLVDLFVDQNGDAKIVYPDPNSK